MATTTSPKLDASVRVCQDDNIIKRKLRAAGLYDRLAENIRASPGKDFLVLHQDTDGAHAFVYHSNPKDSGFTHFHAAHPIALINIIVWFGEQCGGGRITRH